MTYKKPTKKKCAGCGKIFPRTLEFFKPRGRTGNFSSRCIDCLREYNRKKQQESRIARSL